MEKKSEIQNMTRKITLEETFVAIEPRMSQGVFVQSGFFDELDQIVENLVNFYNLDFEIQKALLKHYHNILDLLFPNNLDVLFVNLLQQNFTLEFLKENENILLQVFEYLVPMLQIVYQNSNFFIEENKSLKRSGFISNDEKVDDEQFVNYLQVVVNFIDTMIFQGQPILKKNIKKCFNKILSNLNQQLNDDYFFPFILKLGQNSEFVIQFIGLEILEENCLNFSEIVINSCIVSQVVYCLDNKKEVIKQKAKIILKKILPKIDQYTYDLHLYKRVYNFYVNDNSQNFVYLLKIFPDVIQKSTLEDIKKLYLRKYFKNQFSLNERQKYYFYLILGEMTIQVMKKFDSNNLDVELVNQFSKIYFNIHQFVKSFEFYQFKEVIERNFCLLHKICLTFGQNIWPYISNLQIIKHFIQKKLL